MVEPILSNIVLVGVSGVGKTTLGKMVAGRLEMPFLDTDASFEQEEGLDTDSLMKKYGLYEYDKRMLTHYTEQLKRLEGVLIAASPRIVGSKDFWHITRRYTISFHLRGKPLEVYLRNDVWSGNRKLTKEEKLSEKNKQDYYHYYNWRLNHCQKADFTLRIKGEINADQDALVDLISRVRMGDEKRLN